MSSVPTTGPRPKLSWSDLAGTRAGIWGLGREGHANLRKLLALGAEPVLVDDRPAGPVGPADSRRPVLATAEGGLAALQRCDVVVKTPGLSRYRPEVAHLSTAGHPGGGRPGPVARRGGPAARPVRDRHQGQEHHLLAHRAPPDRARLPVHGRREHRRRALRPGQRGRLRLLGHRGVQLPGHRPAGLAARGRGHVAAPGPPGLARGRGAVLPGQAVRVLPARRRTHRGERRQRPAPRARRAARPADRVGQRARRPGGGLDGTARPPRQAQPAQRAHRPPLPGRPRRAGRRR